MEEARPHLHPPPVPQKAGRSTVRHRPRPQLAAWGPELYPLGARHAIAPSDTERAMELRNIAIIAHVDHGKTTLVDAMLRESGLVRSNQRVQERALDRGDLERERGITILAKTTAIDWRGVRINIVDTPGHADFGGEVERVLGMVDGVLVLVDAAEGPMPQTKFVVGKALRLGLRPIVAISKMDRPDARPNVVHEAVFDLFAALGASDAQLDFPVVYTSARAGWASLDEARAGSDLAPLLDTIAAHVAPPTVAPGPFRMLVSLIESDPYLGRVVTGRVTSGAIAVNDIAIALRRDGCKVEEARVTKLLRAHGLQRLPTERADAGEIVSLAGLKSASVADTVVLPPADTPLDAEPVDPPTIAMVFSVNDSPLAGTDGSYLTSREIGARLAREAEGNVAITVRETEDENSFEVAARGELQLAVLIETMRREGYELSVSRPRVLLRDDPAGGAPLEPMEDIQIDVDEAHIGDVVNTLAPRRAILVDMAPSGLGKTRLLFHGPSRGLIGYNGELLTATRGTGVMHRVFGAYEPYAGSVPGRRNGVLVSSERGEAVAYALWNLEERGELFIVPGTPVYRGMLIGEHARDVDLDVNPLKAKQLTNFRAAGRDDAVRLSPPRELGLEAALAYIADDELVEVTPAHIRLRKRELDPTMRRRAARARKAS